jgi:hypothetical protein
MQIENNKEEVPFSYYAELFSKADPAEISSRLGIPFENNTFRLTLLGKEYEITHPTSEIKPPLPKGGCPEGAGGYKNHAEKKTQPQPDRKRQNSPEKHDQRRAPFMV